jgi:hypothetical protein
MLNNELENNLKKISNRKNKELSVTLRFKSALQYANFQRIKEDLLFVKATLKLLNEIEEKNLLESQTQLDSESKRLIRQNLWFSLIFTYAKCFTDASQGKNTGKLEKKDHLLGATSKITELHDDLIYIRHNYLAHGVENSQEYIVAKLYFLPTNDPKVVKSKLGYEGLRAFGDSPERLNQILELVDIVIDNVKKKIEKIGLAVRKEINNKSIEEWIIEGKNENEG